jgi:hypothetical protein
MDELYDLKADPYEMKNLINQPDAARIVEELKGEIQRLLKGSQAHADHSKQTQWPPALRDCSIALK